MTRSEDLEKHIKTLEEELDKERKLKLLLDRKKHRKMVIGTSPIGDDPLDTVRKVVKAKETSEQRAGVVKNTGSGSLHEEDNTEPTRVPFEPIHDFLTEKCVCPCHPNKKDCMFCYDHPEHLEKKRKKPIKIEYDDVRIAELIEEDKAKKEKQPWWQFLK